MVKLCEEDDEARFLGGKVGVARFYARRALTQCGAKAEALFKWYQENADRDGINSTPTFLIDGQKYSNMAYDEFAEVLDGKLG